MNDLFRRKLGKDKDQSSRAPAPISRGIFAQTGSQTASQKAISVAKEAEYQLDRVLDGVVRSCVHVKTGQIYACKILQKQFLRKHGKEQMVIKECDMLRRAQHENCITLVDFYETPTTYNMIFELATGGELFDRIVEKRKFNERDAATVMATVFNAVAYLHDLGIVHRDLKPENLLFKSPDPAAPLTIVDFGIAKVMDGQNLLRTTCGTPGYTAPEILKNVPYGPKVDVYSLGVVTYILLAGYNPFGDPAKLSEMCERVVRGQYEFHKAHWNYISVEAKDFVAAALRVDPKLRPTAHEMIKHPWLVKYTPPGYLSILRDLNIDAHRRNNPSWQPTADYLDPIPETAAVTRRKTKQASRKSGTSSASGSVRIPPAQDRQDSAVVGVENSRPPPEKAFRPSAIVSFDYGSEANPDLFAHAGADDDMDEDLKNPTSISRDSIKKVGILGLVEEADREKLPIEADIRNLPDLLDGRSGEDESSGSFRVKSVRRSVGVHGAQSKLSESYQSEMVAIDPAAIDEEQEITYELAEPILADAAKTTGDNNVVPEMVVRALSRGRAGSASLVQKVVRRRINGPPSDITGEMLAPAMEKAMSDDEDDMNFFKKVFNPKDARPSVGPSSQSYRDLPQGGGYAQHSSSTSIPQTPKPVSKESEYTMGRTLGQGTYGIVRLCTHVPTQRQLACKVVQKKFLKKTKSENMVHKEVAALRLIAHENCISLVDFFETPVSYCMIFELATGGELFDKIVEMGNFNERDAAVTVATITNAVAFLHDIGIAHRDLKPENLSVSNDMGVVNFFFDQNVLTLIAFIPLTIVDFGISKVVDGSNLLTTVCGTPGYTAPEILRKVPYGMKVDVFSLGVVSYVLLCGYLPFGDTTDIASLCERVIRGEYEFDAPYWNNISDLAKQFVSAAMTTNPDSRPRAHELLKHPWLVKYTPPGYLQYLRDLNIDAHRKTNPDWALTADYKDEIPETPAVHRRKTVQMTRKLQMSRHERMTRKKTQMASHSSSNPAPPVPGASEAAEPAPRLSFDENDEEDAALFAQPEIPEDDEDVVNPFSIDRNSIRQVGILRLSAEADSQHLPIESDIRTLPNLLADGDAPGSLTGSPRKRFLTMAKVVGKMQVARMKANADAAATPSLELSPEKESRPVLAVAVTKEDREPDARRSFDSNNSIGYSPTEPSSPPNYTIPLSEDDTITTENDKIVLASVVRALTRGRAGSRAVPEEYLTSSSAGSEETLTVGDAEVPK
ncbi:hypothetical protein HDU93_006663 [Gonapodya sp. JEL0774]|nr:hypothetical protein HDU93_006663 [Gonapodya sp. JEL0774]